MWLQRIVAAFCSGTTHITRKTGEFTQPAATVEGGVFLWAVAAVSNQLSLWSAILWNNGWPAWQKCPGGRVRPASTLTELLQVDMLVNRATPAREELFSLSAKVIVASCLFPIRSHPAIELERIPPTNQCVICVTTLISRLCSLLFCFYSACRSCPPRLGCDQEFRPADWLPFLL